MTQSRLQSFVEAWSNVAIGFVVSYVMQMIVSALYNLNLSSAQNFQIVIIFTITSVIRSYCLRRYFNKLHTRS